MADGVIARDDGRCTGCGRCAVACPSGAMERIGEYREAAALVDEVVRDGMFFDESGGGVTFSGGEPLAQPAFLEELLIRSRAAGLHTAVDTSGYASAEVFGRIAELADLLLFDVKLVDPAAHRRFAGVDNGLILANLRRVAEMDVAVELRFPVIPGVTDAPENIRAVAGLVGVLPRKLPLRLLGHHRAALAKYARFGIPCRMGAVDDPTPARLAALAAQLRDTGIDVLLSQEEGGSES